MSCFLGVDIGTTSTIGILIGLPDRVLATTSRPVVLSAPHSGWAEEDPADWWANLCAIVPDLTGAAGIDASEIAGIGVTGMLPAVVLLDKAGAVLRPSIQQSDGRCSAEVADMAAEMDEAAFIKKAGNGINQQLVGCKLRWIEKNEPEVFAKAATVFGSYDYINFRLTGERAVEANWALEGGFVDIATDAISPELVRLARIAPSVLPPKISSHEILGRVTAEAAAETGLREGTPVTGGAADFIASGLAAGLAEPGDVLLKFGGSADVLIATKEAVPDPRMYLDYHLIPGLYVPNGCMATGGSALNWFVDRIAYGEKAAAEATGLTVHQHLDQLAEDTPAGADGVQIIPYFLGEKTPIHDPHVRGIISGLSFNHGIAHMWRALLEGFGHAFRHHIEVLNDMGHPTDRYMASDGGSNSKFWVQIVSDILQEPIQLLKGHPGSCLGAAWTAAIATGTESDWRGAARFVTSGGVIAPDPGNAGLYEERYRAFRETYRRLAGPSAESNP